MKKTAAEYAFQGAFGPLRQQFEIHRSTPTSPGPEKVTPPCLPYSSKTAIQSCAQLKFKLPGYP